jgi:calcium-independent phospholipase A2-gamma
VFHRGLATISILKRLEELSHRRIYELFDYVCGVSTGSLIGVMACVYRVPAREMEEIYKEFSVQMFERNRLVGAGKLFMSHAYYDTDLWERILRFLFSHCGFSWLALLCQT